MPWLETNIVFLKMQLYKVESFCHAAFITGVIHIFKNILSGNESKLGSTAITQPN